jgi:N-acetylneuraminic acid mutarotase
VMIFNYELSAEEISTLYSFEDIPATAQTEKIKLDEVSDIGSNTYEDSDNQYLNVSNSGDTLYLSNGNFIIIPGISTANQHWGTEIAPMSIARGGQGCVVVNNKIYAIGGKNTSNVSVNIVEEYDPVKNKWTTKSPMPTARRHFGIAVFDNKIYVIGGGSTSGYVNTVEVYDPVADIWESLPDMPLTARAFLLAATIGETIYVMGGTNHSSDHAENWAYYPKTGTWERKADMPGFRGFISNGAAVLNDKLYVVSGNSNDGSWIEYTSTLVYDPTTDSWSTAGNVNTARGFHGVTALNGKLYLFGGTTQPSWVRTNTVEVYDPATDTWSYTTSMPGTAINEMGIVTLHGKIYIIGGDENAPRIANVRVY